MKFEDRSQEGTERQQRCARGKALNLAGNICKLKEKDKAAFYSPTDKWMMPAASTITHEEKLQKHEAEVCREKETSKAEASLGSSTDSRVNTSWKVLNHLMSIGILPNVNSIKLNRDAKQGTSVCSRTTRLKDNPTKGRKRWWQKCSNYCEKSATIELRITRHSNRANVAKSLLDGNRDHLLAEARS